ncbi:citrate transporter [Lactococcus ileimucosae]|uniref:Citrate transporter n=1 Tax=Lactococcus ileimucosae TaxID=2941329 RepID=A0ABV4D249_9LACT
METLQLIGIIVVFLGAVALMMTRKLPTILALPIMAILISVIAGVPFMSEDPEKFTLVKGVLEDGSMRMATAISGLIFGSLFGKILTKIGVTELIIKKAAEMAGDKALPLALSFLSVASVIFTASNGLGMVILVGTIIIPIMISAGLSPMISSIILLLANGIGVTFSVSTLAVYIDVLGLPLETVTSYSWMVGLPLIIMSIIMVVYFVKFNGKRRKAWAMPANKGRNNNVRSIALIAPIVPVVLVFAFNVPLVAAIITGILAALLLSTPKNPIHVVSSAFVEGIQDIAGAAGLMIGIGMLLNAVMSVEVSTILDGAIEAIIPNGPIMFVVVFGLLAPLAIYRGPLNVWGLGSGIVSLLVAGGMNPVMAMVALRLNSNVQAVCDPTNSHNVWVSDFTKTDVNDVLKKTIPWIWISTVIGLIASTFYLF